MKLSELDTTTRLLVIKIAGEMAVAKITTRDDYNHHFAQSLSEVLQSIGDVSLKA